MSFKRLPESTILLSVYETRVRDFREFVEAENPDLTTKVKVLGAQTYIESSRINWENPGFHQDENHPVVCVSWYDAGKFCDWLTAKERAEGVIGPGQSYQLPTDQEWSLAVELTAESGDTPLERGENAPEGVYPWGHGFPPPERSANIAGAEVLDVYEHEFPFTKVDPEGFRDEWVFTSPVGQTVPNRLGYCDLAGNVAEWCRDSITEKEINEAVQRGGAWTHSTGKWVRSGARGQSDKSYGWIYGGFRVALYGIPEGEAPGRAAGLEMKPAQPGSVWTNSLGIPMVPLDDMRESILFAAFETTVRNFRMFVDETHYNAIGDMSSFTRNSKTGRWGWEKAGNSWESPGFEQGPDYPVVGVSWEDAGEFCRWLTKRERERGLISHKVQYRLPTDEEWSAAAPDSKYFWGDEETIPPGAGNFDGEENAEFWSSHLRGYRDGFQRTAPVYSAAFPPDANGLYHLSGNVAEWCYDSYSPEMNDEEVLKKITVLGKAGDQEFRVKRGASWDVSGKSLTRMRTDFRERGSPGDRDDFTGFRVVLEFVE